MPGFSSTNSQFTDQLTKADSPNRPFLNRREAAPHLISYISYLLLCSPGTSGGRGVREAAPYRNFFTIHYSLNRAPPAPALAQGHFNQGMIAPGNHWNFDSLRAAPPSQVRGARRLTTRAPKLVVKFQFVGLFDEW